mmetsp:Transcript_49413/g.127518  ORF Transcript_49413/g.127518 Transcript_49413/m.127518 type:complete len:256 (+) Transcript_49413:45-812(+)
MAAAVMEPVFLNVERSLVPGLTRIPAQRCPPAGARLPPPPAAFEMPELVENPPQARAGSVGAEAPSEGGFSASDYGFEGRIGGNILAGGLYGLFSSILRPGLRRLSRKAGPAGQLVDIASSAGVSGVAYVAASAFSSSAAALGRVVAQVPILGSSGPLGQALQMGLGTWIGNTVGGLLQAPDRTLDEVFLANMCVMCNSALEVGSGWRVAALTCGHACLCNQGEPKSCVETYLAQRGDCPLCREQGVEVAHDIRL